MNAPPCDNPYDDLPDGKAGRVLETLINEVGDLRRKLRDAQDNAAKRAIADQIALAAVITLLSDNEAIEIADIAARIEQLRQSFVAGCDEQSQASHPKVIAHLRDTCETFALLVKTPTIVLHLEAAPR